jgi:hypothetical protein
LMSTGLAFFSALFVPELAVIHQPAHRRDRVWRHFDEIEPALARHFERISGRDHPDLLPLFVNKPNFADTNALVNASLDWSGYGLPPRTWLLESGPLERRNAAGF